ncbi:alpha-L-rhamnosidase C-terminal domain-containing protein [Schaalia sp. ZJ1691]|uniref:alpha-L-rhamnosidase-related protein n=1 Tax=Schaalia sp. ZJ1691 TaxID=2709404 RepID=UPI0013ECE2A3|nr:alpha-L-rhamnosidase C-terminal domain-containing protein [Schaalia sp. ZJ1691]
MSPLPLFELTRGVRAQSRTPDDDQRIRWFYPHGQFARGAYRALLARSQQTVRHVSYPDNAMFPVSSALFRLRGTGTVSLVASCGQVLDEDEAASFRHESVTTATLSLGERVRLPCTLRVVSDRGEPPALRLDTSECSGLTVDTLSEGEDRWFCADIRDDSPSPPHSSGEPSVVVDLEYDGQLWVTPVPLLGRVIIECDPADSQPRLVVGESRAEALSSSVGAETETQLLHDRPGRWVSENQLGLKFLRVDGCSPKAVRLEASIRRSDRRGAFACSDPDLTQMWTVAATTLMNCMQTLIVDGIKRDRVPWMGDIATSIGPNAFVCGDSTIASDGIEALLSPRQGSVNGIADYTLWGIISVSKLFDFFADESFLLSITDDLNALVTSLVELCDNSGLLRPQKDEYSFPESGPGGIFLDWGVAIDPRRTSTAFQSLWYWALTCALRVRTQLEPDNNADRVQKMASADPWRNALTQLRNTLVTHAWDRDSGAWREYVDGCSSPSPLANTIATLAGLSPTDSPSVDKYIRATKTGTPSMRSWALRSLIERGDARDALQILRKLWGGMLEAGAQTFWEEFPVEGEPHEQMYGRPFGKSLCHGWASGPAELLPLTLLGTRPLVPGWAEFTVSPDLGDLDWAAAVIPAPAGDIAVVAEKTVTTVAVPRGTTLVVQEKRINGPALHRW